MKRKPIFDALVLFVIQSIVGGMVNYFYTEPLLWKSIARGISLGIVTVVWYISLIVIWGYAIDDYTSKTYTILLNTIYVFLLWYSFIEFTTINDEVRHVWLNRVYIVFAILLVLYAYREGKRIKKN